jgi:signal peptidase II
MNGCRAGWAVCGFTALGVILDLSVKALAREWLTPHNPVALMPGLNLNLGFNTGVAFGLFADRAALTFTLMVLVQVGLITVLIVMLFRTTGVARYYYAAIVSGALGNLVDRLTSGAVTDYIDVYAGTWHWPTFNLADIFISLGVAGLISHELFFDGSRTAVQE